MADLRVERKGLVTGRYPVNLNVRPLNDGTSRSVLETKDARGRLLYHVVTAAELEKLFPTPPAPTPPSSTAPTYDLSTRAAWDGGEQIIGNASITAIPGFRKGFPEATRHVVGPPGVGQVNVDGAYRAEMMPSLHVSEDEDWWWAASLRTPGQQWLKNGDHHTLMQWKQDGSGSPPFEVAIFDWDTPDLILRYAGGPDRGVNLIPASQMPNTINDLALGIRFSSDPTKGHVEAWVNGSHLFTVVFATLVAGRTSYLKEGLYSTGVQTNTVDWAATALGKTIESVAPWIRFPV